MKKSFLLLITCTMFIVTGCGEETVSTPSIYPEDTKCIDGPNGVAGEPYSGVKVEAELLSLKAEYDTKQTITLSNPRTDVGENVYPILISPALGMNGGCRTFTSFVDGHQLSWSYKGDVYSVFFDFDTVALPNLVFSSKYKPSFYDATPVTTNTQYNISFKKGTIGTSQPNVPSYGYFLFAFLTQAEYEQHLSKINNINLPNSVYIDANIMNALKELGALKQYKWSEY